MAGCDCSLGLMQWWSHNALCCSWQCCGLAKGQYSWDMTEACRVDVDRGVWISRLRPSAGQRLLHISGSWVHYPAAMRGGGGSVELHDLGGNRQVDAQVYEDQAFLQTSTWHETECNLGKTTVSVGPPWTDPGTCTGEWAHAWPGVPGLRGRRRGRRQVCHLCHESHHM